jgi:GDP-4-dehydro-6-deoxy-D-mannose reductase
MTGFVGGHLTERLLTVGGHTVTGLSRRGVWPKELAHLQNQAELVSCDLHDRDRLAKLIHSNSPDWVFHLAGYANTGKSFEEPEHCWRDNLDATRQLFDAIAQSKTRPRILFVSTGLIYGDPDPGLEYSDERTTLKPASPYAASKAAADLVAYQVSRTAKLDVMRVRLFNQIGPRQSADYAIPNFARQIVAIEQGEQKPLLETGDLSAYRDLTDVRDMVRAMILVMQKGESGSVYNAGSGSVRQIGEVLRMMIELAHVSVEVRTTSGTGRLGDTTKSKADPRKLKMATGWEPVYELKQTLLDVLENWRTFTNGKQT